MKKPIACILFLLLFFSPAFSGRLPVIRVGRQRYPPRHFQSDVSKKNLLGIERKRDGLPKEGLKEPVWLRICAIRVEFQPDSNTNSTGPGTFELSRDTTVIIDPPPHNKSYFNAHLQALADYWYAASNGKIILTWDIFPTEEEASYRLPDSMAYYGPNGWLGNMSARLKQFFIDAWETALSSDEIPIGDYDVFIVFHAGADWQNDIGSSIPPEQNLFPDIFVPSPDDLPTAFITFDEPVVGGVISEGLIIPEFASQDGQITALNGLLAHEFGHAFGLVDLYSTYDFRSEVGDFSLMDHGGLIAVQIDAEGTVASALLPAYPSAWERAYLGFEDVVEITESRDSLKLFAPELERERRNTIYKIPIDDYEYFLVENREEIVGRDSVIYLHQDPETGVVLGPIYDDYTPNCMYDYLLPASGVLIWHIDERVAYMDYTGSGETNFEENTLQWDQYRLFIDLEEASCYQDIGVYYTYGDPDDAYFIGGNETFSPTSCPNSNSNTGGRTGITIQTLTAPGDSMAISVENEFVMAADRLFFGFTPLAHPFIVDFDHDGKDEIFLTVEGYILAWDDDFSKLIPNYDNIAHITSFDTTYYPFPVIVDCPGYTVSPLIFTDLDSDGTDEMLLTNQRNELVAYRFSDENSDGRCDLFHGFPILFEDEPVYHPVVLDGGIIAVPFKNGKVRIISFSGDIVSELDTRGEIKGLVPADDTILYILSARAKGRLFRYNIATDELELLREFPEEKYTSLSGIRKTGTTGGEFYLSFLADGILYLLDENGKTYPGFPRDMELSSFSEPAALNIDGNETFEIAFSGDNKLFCVDEHGVLLPNFPFEADSTISTPPLITETGLLFSVEGEAIYCIDRIGKIIPPFPVSSSGGVWYSLSSGNIDGTGRDEIIFAADDGFVHIYKGLISGGAKSDRFGRNIDSVDVELPVDATSGKPVITKAYNYPNPMTDKTYIHYEIGIGTAERVTVRIFDLSGRLIDRFAGTTHAINDILWQTRDRAAGTYICTVSAEGTNGEIDTKRFVIAIVK